MANASNGANAEITKLYAVLNKEMTERHAEVAKGLAEISKTLNAQATYFASVMSKISELVSSLETISSGGGELGAEFQTVSRLALGESTPAAAPKGRKSTAKKGGAEHQIVSVLKAFKEAKAASDGAGSSDGAAGAGKALAEFYSSDLFKDYMKFLLDCNKGGFIKAYVQAELTGLELPWNLMDGIEPISILTMATEGPAIPCDRVVDAAGTVTYQKPVDPSVADYWMFATGEAEHRRDIIGGGEGFINPECEKDAFIKQKKSNTSRAYNVGYKLSKKLTTDQKNQIESHQKQLAAAWVKVAREPLTQEDAGTAGASS